MEIRFHHSITEIPGSEWNRLFGCDHPFTRHEFLAALESSGSACAATGWQPAHLSVRDAGGSLRAAMPLYLKSHSSGEYVFDWSWADFWQRQGRSYYPKLLTAIPFTPCSGARLGHPELPDRERTELFMLVNAAVRELAAQHRLSSWHVLFPSEPEPLFEAAGFLRRDGWRYLWNNKGYGHFDDFLAALSSKKRKNIRQELRGLEVAGIRFDVLEAEAISTEHWDHFYRLYQATYLRHGQLGYLEPGFFQSLSESMCEHLVMVRALRDEQCIGAALCLRSATTLYGRYWGCTEAVPGLHFATCYYQGIAYCIQRGLQVFDPGVQGEHKIARGFLPAITHSWHWIADPELGRAVQIFLQQESEAVGELTGQLAQRTPFRRNPEVIEPPADD